MLRLSKNEKKQLANLNARIRRKRKNLKETFNISSNIEYKTPTQFKTRAEVNAYKEQARVFLAPYTQKYIKGGLKKGGQYYYAIPYSDYSEIRSEIRKQNQIAKKLMREARNIKFTSKNVVQSVTLEEQIEVARPQYRKPNKIGGRLQAFFPIKFSPSTIKSDTNLQNFKYGLKQFNTKEYYEKKNTVAKNNFCQALENTFGNMAKPITALIDALTPEEFILLYESEVWIDFEYVYDESKRFELLQTIGTAILNYIKERDLQFESKYSARTQEKLKQDVIKLLELDSDVILSEYSSHYAEFNVNGHTYGGSFRAKELEDIKNKVNLEYYAKKITTRRLD